MADVGSGTVAAKGAAPCSAAQAAAVFCQLLPRTFKSAALVLPSPLKSPWPTEFDVVDCQLPPTLFRSAALTIPSILESPGNDFGLYEPFGEITLVNDSVSGQVVVRRVAAGQSVVNQVIEIADVATAAAVEIASHHRTAGKRVNRVVQDAQKIRSDEVVKN